MSADGAVQRVGHDVVGRTLQNKKSYNFNWFRVRPTMQPLSPSSIPTRMTDDIKPLPAIVMVDADTTAREQNARYLRGWGFEVVETETPVQCLDVLAQRPDVGVLFTRVALGDVNGFELALLVRRDRPSIKVFMATNDEMAAHKTRALCDQYIWTK